jgi:hypothetical protein
MGGFGSGRHGGHPTAEATASYVLNATLLTRLNLQAGQHARGTITFGKGEFPVEIAINTADPSGPYIELSHKTRDWREGDRSVRYRVNLLWTVPTYGGRRWWFQCPRTHRKVAKLYLPNGGWRFWSRRAYRLGYACQRETELDRLMRKARKLSIALGGDGDMDIPPQKPKGMRWNTYDRRISEWEEAACSANIAFSHRAAAILRRFR